MISYELFIKYSFCISKFTWYNSAKIYSNNGFFSKMLLPNYKKNVGDQYLNYGQNIILNSAF